jgi:hypothetical protein
MEYRYEGHALSGSQIFVCREYRKIAAMIKGSLYICNGCCATSCDAEGIAMVAGFFPSQTPHVFCFSFAKPSDIWFGPSQKGTICSSVYVLFVPLQSVPKIFKSFKMHHIEKFTSILFGKLLGACHSVFSSGLDFKKIH